MEPSASPTAAAADPAADKSTSPSASTEAPATMEEHLPQAPRRAVLQAYNLTYGPGSLRILFDQYLN